MVRDVSVILLFDEKNRILLQQRDFNTKRAPGKWGFFGGGIEIEETPKEAVIREAKEETGIDLTNPIFVKSHKNNYGDTLYVFTQKYEGQKIILGEGQDYNWFTQEEINELDMISHDKEILIELYNKNLGK